MGFHESGAIGGEADLLLMMPVLGEFASGVEPVKGLGLSRPRN